MSNIYLPFLVSDAVIQIFLYYLVSVVLVNLISAIIAIIYGIILEIDLFQGGLQVLVYKLQAQTCKHDETKDFEISQIKQNHAKGQHPFRDQAINQSVHCIGLPMNNDTLSQYRGTLI